MKETLSVSETWAEEVYSAVDQFVSSAGIHKADLAHACGIDPTSLSMSHLRRPRNSRYLYQRLPYVLRASVLTERARELCLDRTGYLALKALAGTILQVNFGFAVAPDNLIAGTKEAVDLGMWGVDLFDRRDWTRAVPFLKDSWGCLAQGHPEPGTTAFLATLRVGTQLTSFQAYASEAKEALGIVQHLCKLVRQYQESGRLFDTKTLAAIALLYRDAGTILRHNRVHPEYVIEKYTIAYRLMQSHGLCRRSRIAVLRDQAKPYIVWGLRDSSVRTEKFAQAFAVLEQAECLAGGKEPDEEAREEWLYTRLTWIECLVALKRYSEAVRLYEETMAAHWVTSLFTAGTSAPLAAKLKLSQMAVTLALGNLDLLAEHAQRFCGEYKNSPLVQRVERAEQILRLATAGEIASLQMAMIG